jgi:Ca2+/Na+ antiporter
VSVVRIVLGALLVVVGAVWFGQGVGWIGGSFMTGEAVWGVIGALCVIAGVWLALSARRARDQRS